jgi:hypothetical protein
MIDVVNQITGVTVVTGATCAVASGLATYLITSGSFIAQTPGRYVGYMRVQLDAQTADTFALPFDVLDKGSYLVVDRWQRKVADSAPTQDHDDDEHARDWIDQAVDYLNRKYTLGYTSVLGMVNPHPDSTAVEMIASVASVMARAAWWAGKGNWRDAEMTFDATPFKDEWDRIDAEITRLLDTGWTDNSFSGTMFNRDSVYYDGVKLDSPDYWNRWSTEPEPNTEIPI